MANAIAFSPNGRLAISTNSIIDDQGAAVASVTRGFAPESGTPRYEFDAAPAMANSVHFSPDGALCALTGETGVYVFDPATGQKKWSRELGHRTTRAWFSTRHTLGVAATLNLYLLDADTGQVRQNWFTGRKVPDMAMNPDGNRLAVWGDSEDPELRWTLAVLPETVGSFGEWIMTRSDPIRGFRFHPTNRQTVAHSVDGFTWIAGVASGYPHDSFRHPAELKATQLAFSPDGTKLALTGGGKLAVYKHHANTVDHTPLFVIDVARNGFPRPTFSSDSKLLLVGTSSAGAETTSASVVDASTGIVKYTLRHPVSAREAEFSPDCGLVATVSRAGATVFAIHGSALPITTLQHGKPVHAVAFDPTGRLIATACEDSTTRVFDAASGNVRTTLHHEGPVVDVEYSTDGLIHTASRDGKARSFAADGNIVTHIDHDGPVCTVNTTPDARFAVSGSEDFTARIADLRSPGASRRLVHDGVVRALDCSHDSTLVLTGSDDNLVRLFNVTNGIRLLALNHGGPVNAVAFSPDHVHFASASDDKTVRVFTLDGTEVMAVLHRGPARAVAFSPDGGRLVTGSDDGTARILCIAADAVPLELEHEGPVGTVAFSRDGQRIATGSDDGKARIFNSYNGSKQLVAAHRGPVNRVVFSPDDTMLATASNDGGARVYDVRST